MRPLDNSPVPYLVPSAGSGVPLRAGAFVSLRVIAEAGGGLYRVLVGGSELKASSSVPLLPGSFHRARVERAGPGDSRLLLRLLPSAEERTVSLLASLGHGADPASRLALAALLAEGLRPEAGALARLRRVVQRSPAGREAEFAELAAGLEAKGLGAEAEAVEALAGLSEGGGEGGGRSGRDRERGDPRGGDGERGKPPGTELGPAAPPGTELEPGEPPLGTELEPSELVPALAALISALLIRCASPDTPDEALLGLYNHVRSPAGASFLVPFRFALDLVEFAGSFRVHLPYMPGGQSRIEARFTVEKGTSTESWGFLLESLPGGTARLLLDAGRKLSESLLSELEAELAALGCKLGLGKESGTEGGRMVGGAAEIDLDA